ncbi:hypothetical protein [Desulfobulbus alkaliphilus]|uniref:hypothetical protein n=1 Tax=Desulfobulbus alkaliphilus TaxID=869814 RepID=UPI00196618A7|nr:hypothetical protein [Desulfobulbus alkaliphilus]MBM9537449.1 hypothetical protein [Desulfobulbus alkaliphilus]
MQLLHPARLLTALLFILAGFVCPLHALGNHQSLTGPFADARAVTKQCLSCHAGQGEDILQSSHWTWERSRIIGAEQRTFAKKTGLTFFAVSVTANPSRCMTCHISTNLLSGRHDPSAAADIDCLVCHDTTGTYRRELGAPVDSVDLARIAAKVGPPRPTNCLTCHGRECGLTGLQGHGGFDTDVHLHHSGAALSCQQCHPGQGRHVLQRQLTLDEADPKKTGCIACHSSTPHAREQLNRHATTIACQTCHIPVHGRTTPALIHWNWLMGSGTTVDQYTQQPTPFQTAEGLTMASNLLPTYLWDNGGDQIYERGGRIQPETLTSLLSPSPRDQAARIHPFAVLFGTQLYDARYRYLISPALTRAVPTFFSDAGWDQIAAEGMNNLRLPFSGSLGFTTTASFRRLNHGVAPTAQALGCMDCHGKSGRLPWDALGYTNDPWIEGLAPDRSVERSRIQEMESP